MSSNLKITLLFATALLLTSTFLTSGEIISCSSFEQCEAATPQIVDRIEQLEALLAGVSRTDDANGYDTLTFSGVNVQIVNGTGTTAGDPDGKGNLIIGYNEFRDESNATVACPSDVETESWCNRRTGSHNLIVGTTGNYSSFGGTVIGISNEISNDYASVSGGVNNIASGIWSSVSGGGANRAIGGTSSVSGGGQNKASGSASSVSGGVFNNAEANFCWEGGLITDC
jgi:hypothetical protein